MPELGRAAVPDNINHESRRMYMHKHNTIDFRIYPFHIYRNQLIRHRKGGRDRSNGDAMLSLAPRKIPLPSQNLPIPVPSVPTPRRSP